MTILLSQRTGETSVEGVERFKAAVWFVIYSPVDLEDGSN